MDDCEVLERSPFLANLKRKGRLAPSRLSDLLAAAKASTPPREPELWDCCGSSCKPCVKEIWRQEMKGWEECHPDGQDEDILEDAAGTEAKEAEVRVEEELGGLTIHEIKRGSKEGTPDSKLDT